MLKLFGLPRRTLSAPTIPQPCIPPMEPRSVCPVMLAGPATRARRRLLVLYSGGLLVALAVIGTFGLVRQTPPLPLPVAATFALASGMHGILVGASQDQDDMPDEAVADDLTGQIDLASPSNKARSSIRVGATTDDQVRLRREPSLSSPVIMTLPRGTELEVIGRQGDWYKVATAKAVVGWVNDTYFVVKTPSPDTSATPQATPTPHQTSDAEQRWIWPVGGTLTSRFGYRRLKAGTFHNGIDLANPKGTPISAARAGTVTEAGWCRGYGYCVKIEHGGGFLTEYGHMAWRPPVHVGAQVAAGQLIGYVGSTYDRKGGGYSTGNHLHFTIKKDGQAVNPLRYLP